ncbi:MAG: hypothetical protein PHG58_11200 [Clostridia bacterium]|nr:hypothetical protein [Clostridia bacterium]
MIRHPLFITKTAADNNLLLLQTLIFLPYQTHEWQYSPIPSLLPINIINSRPEACRPPDPRSPQQ